MEVAGRDKDTRLKVIGGVAQLGERLPCTQEVIGSIPFTSTSFMVERFRGLLGSRIRFLK